jgi:hypothetical protein
MLLAPADVVKVSRYRQEKNILKVPPDRRDFFMAVMLMINRFFWAEEEVGMVLEL